MDDMAVLTGCILVSEYIRLCPKGIVFSPGVSYVKNHRLVAKTKSRCDRWIEHNNMRNMRLNRG